MVAIKPKIKFNRIRKVFKKTLRILGEKTFLAFLVLLFFGVAFGIILFYQSSISAQKTSSEVSEKPLQLDEELLEKVLGKWEEREKIFNEAEERQYPDPFWGVIPAPEEEGLE